MERSRRYWIAAALASAAVLVKYTGLLLLPALFLDLLARGDMPLRSRLRLALIGMVPVLVLLAWSGFNVLDYGGAHMLSQRGAIGASVGENAVTRAKAWLLCLGVITPGAVLFVAGAVRALGKPWARFAAVVALALPIGLVVLATAFLAHLAGEAGAYEVLKAVALLAGVGVFGLGVVASGAALRVKERDRRADGLLLAYWAWSAAAFVILLAPFMATRHALLSLPPLLLLMGRFLRPWLTRRWSFAAIAVAAGLTAVMAAGDDWYAGLYRRVAPEVRGLVPADVPVWFAGYHGWKWYAEQAGLEQVAISHPAMQPGDVLAIQAFARRPDMPPSLALQETGRIPLERPCCLPYFVASDRGFYWTTIQHLPWGMTRAPIDEISSTKSCGAKARGCPQPTPAARSSARRRPWWPPACHP